MILSHYCARGTKVDLTRTYDLATDPMRGDNDPYIRWAKPYGLWLSDESDRGWESWCLNEQFAPQRLYHRYDFEVDTSKVLVIDSDFKLQALNEQYGGKQMDEGLGPSSRFNRGIDWARLRELYKGIVISPYQDGLRFNPNFFWYYSWDCASGCIWDLSCLTPVNQFMPIRTLKRRMMVLKTGYQRALFNRRMRKWDRLRKLEASNLSQTDSCNP